MGRFIRKPRKLNIMTNLEAVVCIYQEYQDDNEGLSPQDYLSQFDLSQEEQDYFFLLLN